MLCIIIYPGCTSLPTAPTAKFESREQIPCYISCKRNHELCIEKEELVAERFIFRKYKTICQQARTICELKQCNRYLECKNNCRISFDQCMGPEGPKDTQQSDVICFQSNYLCKQNCRINEILSPYRVVDHTWIHWLQEGESRRTEYQKIPVVLSDDLIFFTGRSNKSHLYTWCIDNT